VDNFEKDLTVITAVFNGAEYLRETIDSVLNFASGTNYEYIVIDDGSTDETAEILKSYSGRIKVFTHKNVGESESVNVGIRNAKGACCLVISADDPLFTSKIFENCLEQFVNNPGLAAIYPDWRMIDENGEVIKNILVPEYSDELLIGRCRTLPGPGVIFRTKFAQQINGRNRRWTYVGDYDFWLRLSRLGQLKRRPEVLAQWRYHKNSTSVTKRGLRMARERIEVIEEFVANYDLDCKIVRMARGNSYFMAARLSFFASDVPGKRYLLKSYWLRKGWVEETNIGVVLYILFSPISSHIAKPLIIRSKRMRTLI
jgi:glycosyltransferase involved in cell wall biosynthesis